jgi:predicted RNA methylase
MRTQYSLFADDETTHVADLHPEDVPSLFSLEPEPTCPPPQIAQTQPAPFGPKAPRRSKASAELHYDPSIPDEPYNGWPNSATYLADLYLSDSFSGVSKVRSLMTESFSINDRKLAAMFPIVTTTEDDSDRDDYVTGLIDGNLVLDYWAAPFRVDWKAIAAAFSEEARLEQGLQPVERTVLEILGSATVAGRIVKLNSPGLARDTYDKVDKMLRVLGGHWNRRLGGHLFDADPTEALEDLLQTGRVVKTDNLGAFFTPGKLADQVILEAKLEAGMLLLEPNGGRGALLTRAAEIVGHEHCVAVEIQDQLAEALRAKGFKVYTADFLSQPHFGPHRLLFDRVVMNPPFRNQADIDHVLHAYSMLARNGRLVAIMSGGVMFRNNAKTTAFRDLVHSCGGTFTENPAGSFKESGTSVNTVIVTMNKMA